MSDQEMHFADPDWQPSQQRRAAARSQPAPSTQKPANDVPAQPQAGEAEQESVYPGSVGDGDKATYDPYEAGYRSRQASGSKTSQASGTQSQQTHEERQGAFQARRRRSPWLWSIIALIILAILVFSPFGEDTLLVIPRVILLLIALSAVITFLSFIIQHGRPGAQRVPSETQSFTVGAQPKIIVKGESGTIFVHPGGEPGQVVVQATRHGSGLLSFHYPIQCEQNLEKNRLSIKARSAWHFLGRNSLALDITVPRLADLELRSEAGSITVSDVEGQMNLVSQAGSVKANEVILCGDSRLKTNAGSITFVGSLDSNGSYSMTTDAGSVNVTLPAESSFRLDARTDVGNINTHFPFTIQRDFPGAKARGKVGPGPYPSLKLRTDVGSINLWQG